MRKRGLFVSFRLSNCRMMKAMDGWELQEQVKNQSRLSFLKGFDKIRLEVEEENRKYY